MLKNLLLSFVVIIILSLAFEGIARKIVNPPLYRFDETLGFVPRPDTVNVHKAEFFEAVYHINKLGYRGEEYNKDKRPGIFRIVVMGDSNGFGWGVQDNETFPAIIDKRLKNVEVINLSVSGYGTDQEFLRLKKEGLSYQPDLVIIQITANDFTEIKKPSMYGKDKPYFILLNGKLIFKKVPVKSSCDSTTKTYIACVPLPYRDWLHQNSRAYRFLNIGYLRLKMWLDNVLSLVIDQDPLHSNENDNLTKIDEDGLELFKAIINEMNIELRAKGIKAVVMHADPYLSAIGKIDDIDTPVIDLYPFLQNQKDIQIPRDWHYNKKGHALIAEGFISALIKHNLLPIEHR